MNHFCYHIKGITTLKAAMLKGPGENTEWAGLAVLIKWVEQIATIIIIGHRCIVRAL